MRLNVAQLLKEPVGSRRFYDVDEQTESHLEKEGIYSVRGRVSVLHLDKGALVDGVLIGNAIVPCARCLNPFQYQLRLDIKEEYFSTLDVTSGLTLPLPDEPGLFTIDTNHIIDLDEAVHQYSLMNLPIKPLCRQDCAGLCPFCGKNLNDGPCRCSVERTHTDNVMFSVVRASTIDMKGVNCATPS